MENTIIVYKFRSPNSKIDEDIVRAIRKEHREGARQVFLSGKYGLTQSSISNIVRRKTWSHVSDEV